MLDSMFQEGTDQALDDRVSRPLQAPTAKPSFGISLWNTAAALPKGVVSGANKMAAASADIVGAFGQVQAGIGLQADPTLLFDSEAQNKRVQDGQKARAELQSGEAFSTELGTGLRATARTYTPDPATSNMAENLLFGLSDFAVRAVGYSVMGGPAGPVLMGADEGMTEADRLKAEGVDINTRTKVGLVSGVTAAAQVALPVAGATRAQTAALVTAGGPGSFIAQQAASRAILENAGYDKIADQYDPFDPVGLAVSTLVPAAFGAYAMRGSARTAKPSPSADTAATHAPIDMGGNERLAERQGAEAGRAAANDPEIVAAARVQLVRDTIADSNLHAPTDIAGANQHTAAIERAHEQMAAGEPVNVTDLIDGERIDVVRLQKELVEPIQTNAIAEMSIPDFVTNPAKTSMNRANRITSDLMADSTIPAEIKQRLQQNSIELMKPENRAYVAAVDAARKAGDIDPEIVSRIYHAMRPAEPAKVAVNAETTAAKPATKQAESATKAAGEGKATASPLDTQVDEIARLSPHMMVQFDGMDKPMRLADALESVRLEAAKDAEDAPLLRVAVECALMNA